MQRSIFNVISIILSLVSSCLKYVSTIRHACCDILSTNSQPETRTNHGYLKIENGGRNEYVHLVSNTKSLQNNRFFTWNTTFKCANWQNRCSRISASFERTICQHCYCMEYPRTWYIFTYSSSIVYCHKRLCCSRTYCFPHSHWIVCIAPNLQPMTALSLRCTSNSVRVLYGLW